MKNGSVFLALLIAVFLLSGCAATTKQKESWEYKVISVDLLGDKAREVIKNSPLIIAPEILHELRSNDYGKRASKTLSDLGEQGWELVSVDENYYTLKRSKRSG
jgi:hypothetical protein